MQQQRLDLRGKGNAIRGGGVIERLLAQAIARKKERPPSSVPQRKREHAVKPVEAALAPALIAGKQRLRVGSGRKTATRGLEFVAKGLMIIDLAVVTQDRGPRGVGHRLMATA